MLLEFKKIYDFILFKRRQSVLKGRKRKEKSLHKKIFTRQDGNRILYDIIKSSKPASIGKIGTTELKCLKLHFSNEPEFKWEAMKMKSGRYFGGIYPDTPDLFERFSKIYYESLTNIDILGLWYNKGEYEIVRRLPSEVKLVDGIQFIEPFYSEEPWSRALEGLKVLIVHPFETSIKAQYSNRNQIWTNNVLPDFDLKTLRVPQNAGVQTPLFPDWVQTLHFLKNEIEKIEFDIALIGAGGWSIPLCNHVKGLGKVGIHMGGGLQILFGIKGARWNQHPVISSFFNEKWIRVMNEDQPDKLENIGSIPEKDRYW